MRILLVDDDEGTRFVARHALRRLGIGSQVHEAGSGEEAIRVLDARPFDAVVTDYNMGAASGVDVLCRAKDVQPRAKRILMSGTLEAKVLRSVAARACIEFAFEKPMEMGAWQRMLRAGLQAEGELEPA